MNTVNKVLNNPKKATKAMCKMLSEHLSMTESLYSMCREQHLLDSQEVLDWQDGLNEISVRYDVDLNYQ